MSSPEKAALATAAGADHVVNYRNQDAATAIRDLAPDCVHAIVEVAPGPNAALNAAVAAPWATVAVYADDGGPEVTLPIWPHLQANLRYQFILVYTIPQAGQAPSHRRRLRRRSRRALPVGELAGLPLHRFRLSDTAQAHRAVQSGLVGKALIDLP